MCLRQRPAWWCKKGRTLTLRWQQWGFSMRHELRKLPNQWWRIALMLTFSPWLWDTRILYSQDSLDSVLILSTPFSWSNTCCRCTIFIRSQAHVTVWISHKNLSKTSPKSTNKNSRNWTQQKSVAKKHKHPFFVFRLNRFLFVALAKSRQIWRHGPSWPGAEVDK